MSLPELARPERDRSRPRDAIWRFALVAVCLAPLLSACDGATGLRPLYGAAGIGAQANEKLARVVITPIPSKAGQRIRNELIFTNYGGGTPPPPEYRLDLIVKTSLTTTLVQLDGSSLGQVYNIDADFQLTRLSDKKVVLKGTSFGRAGFERYTSIFSSVRASDDAEEHAAKTIATDLRARLGAFFGGQS